MYGKAYPFQVAAETLAGSLTAYLIALKAKEKGININCFLTREERKITGLVKNIEGKILNRPVVIVDDIFNTGDTFSYLFKILKSKNCKIHSLFVFFNHQNKYGQKFLKDEKIKLNALFSASDFGLQPKISDWQHKEIKIKPNWKFSSPEPSYCYVVQKSSPSQDKNNIYLGADSGFFYSLAKKSGQVNWKFKTGEHIQKKSILSSSLIYDNKVYFGSYDGSLYALDAKTGQKKWEFTEADWIGSSPALSKKDNLIFVGLEFGLPGRRGGIVAVDAQTGAKKWADFFVDYVHCSPEYSAEFSGVVVGSNCGYVRMYEAKTGQKKWEFKVGSAVKACFIFDAPRKFVFFGAHDGRAYVLDVESGQVIYSYKTEGIIYSTPLIKDNVLYFTSLDKSLYGLDLDTGKLKYSFLTCGKLFTTPVIWRDYVVFGSNDGRVYFLNFAKKTEYFIQFTERMTNRVIFDDQQMYVYLYNNELHTFDLPDI